MVNAWLWPARYRLPGLAARLGTAGLRAPRLSYQEQVVRTGSTPYTRAPFRPSTFALTASVSAG